MDTQIQHNSICSGMLMCSPEYFDVQYIINPWMKSHVNSLNKIQAEIQWNALYDIIKSHTTVRVADSMPGLLDMVFIANAALVIDNKCVIANFKHQERKGETPHWKQWFLSHGYEVLDIPNNLCFEGEGDALYDASRKCIWGGYNTRSHREAYTVISEFFDKEVVLLELIDSYFYHIDTCFALLPNGYVMYVPEAFSLESLSRIESRVPQNKRIILTLAEAKHFTCNAVVINDIIICNHAVDRVKQELLGKGFTCIESILSEFMKAGGAAKCLVLSLYNL